VAGSCNFPTDSRGFPTEEIMDAQDKISTLTIDCPQKYGIFQQQIFHILTLIYRPKTIFAVFEF